MNMDVVVIVQFQSTPFAVPSLQNGDDVKTAQDNLSHATAAFMLDVYGHASERMKEESAARMQNYIGSISGL